MRNSKERFSNRVENYVKYRPSYPREVLTLLQDECGLTADSIVADVGSGTGIFAELLLDSGAKVIGIEPNTPMREAAESLLGSNPRFLSVNATAEDTPLDFQSVSLVTAAQAFHWFDWRKSRAEFDRILRPGGMSALIWNDRASSGTPFLDGYERILREHSPDYAEVNHRHVGNQDLDKFFAPRRMRVAEFDNVQTFDFEGLRGRLLSSSYVPAEGMPGHEEILEAARELFERTKENGLVSFIYKTLVFYG